MIAIDLFADLLGWDETTAERNQRIYRVSRSLYASARVGKAAASPLIFVEAAMAFLDALGAYASYKQAQSQTCELKAEGAALARRLDELEKQFRVKAQLRDIKFSAHMQHVREQLALQDKRLTIGVVEFESLAKDVKKLGERIALMRMDSAPNCVPLLKLERAYYQLVDAQLSTALTLLDE